MSARKNREEFGMFLFDEGTKLEVLSKIFTLVISFDKTDTRRYFNTKCRRRFHLYYIYSKEADPR